MKQMCQKAEEDRESSMWDSSGFPGSCSQLFLKQDCTPICQFLRYPQNPQNKFLFCFLVVDDDVLLFVGVRLLKVVQVCFHDFEPKDARAKEF